MSTVQGELQIIRADYSKKLDASRNFSQIIYNYFYPDDPLEHFIHDYISNLRSGNYHHRVKSLLKQKCISKKNIHLYENLFHELQELFKNRIHIIKRLQTTFPDISDNTFLKLIDMVEKNNLIRQNRLRLDKLFQEAKLVPKVYKEITTVKPLTKMEASQRHEILSSAMTHYGKGVFPIQDIHKSTNVSKKLKRQVGKAYTTELLQYQLFTERIKLITCSLNIICVKRIFEMVKSLGVNAMKKFTSVELIDTHTQTNILWSNISLKLEIFHENFPNSSLLWFYQQDEFEGIPKEIQQKRLLFFYRGQLDSWRPPEACVVSFKYMFSNNMHYLQATIEGVSSGIVFNFSSAEGDKEFKVFDRMNRSILQSVLSQSKKKISMLPILVHQSHNCDFIPYPISV